MTTKWYHWLAELWPKTIFEHLHCRNKWLLIKYVPCVAAAAFGQTLVSFPHTVQQATNVWHWDLRFWLEYTDGRGLLALQLLNSENILHSYYKKDLEEGHYLPSYKWRRHLSSKLSTLFNSWHGIILCYCSIKTEILFHFRLFAGTFCRCGLLQFYH